MHEKFLMDLYIETLTGTAFELRVSPFDSIMSIKARIQRLEGKWRPFAPSRVEFINHRTIFVSFLHLATFCFCFQFISVVQIPWISMFELILSERFSAPVQRHLYFCNFDKFLKKLYDEFLSICWVYLRTYICEY